MPLVDVLSLPLTLGDVDGRTERWSLADSRPATADAVPVLRHAVVDLAERAGADREAREAIAIATTEACTNVVLHAYIDADRPGPLEVDARVEGDCLEVVVRDEGRGMRPRRDSPGLGVGLQLIARLSRRMQIATPTRGSGTELHLWLALGRG
jgi:serine/threonine-protein kinase RsbW